MKLSTIRILNFRSCRDVALALGDMHALVGANNAGKSTVLRALDFLFNPSTKSLDEESFWSKDTSQEIRVEAVFSDLADREQNALAAYLSPDGTFQMARSARMGATKEESDSDAIQGEDRIEIRQHYRKPIPEPEWLQEAQISSKTITEWWKEPEKLTVGDFNFTSGMTKKPSVEEWKEKAKDFVAAHVDKIPMQETWVDNPRGYANVLKWVSG